MSIPLVEWIDSNARQVKAPPAPPEPLKPRLIRLGIKLVTLLALCVLIRLAS